jgi:transcriptional regulator with PAS, ATPase and Fis domain
MIESKEFLAPLYYRISKITIKIPPLCQRIEDIQLLAERFLRKECPDRIIKISPDALSLLKTYPWPGNVRELENEIGRIVFDYEDIANIQPEHLLEEIREGVTLKATKKIAVNLERDRIVQALKATHGNVSRAAKTLDIPRATLQGIIDRLEVPDFRQN